MYLNLDAMKLIVKIITEVPLKPLIELLIFLDMDEEWSLPSVEIGVGGALFWFSFFPILLIYILIFKKLVEIFWVHYLGERETQHLPHPHPKFYAIIQKYTIFKLIIFVIK